MSYQSINPANGKILKNIQGTHQQAARDSAQDRRSLLRNLAA